MTTRIFISILSFFFLSAPVPKSRQDESPAFGRIRICIMCQENLCYGFDSAFSFLFYDPHITVAASAESFDNCQSSSPSVAGLALTASPFLTHGHEAVLLIGSLLFYRIPIVKNLHVSAHAVNGNRETQDHLADKKTGSVPV